jgi:hypothetical protein
LPLTRNDKIELTVLGVLAILVGILSMFMTGKPESDQAFLIQLNNVNTQLLAFSGVILGVLYPSLRSFITDMGERLVAWKRDLVNLPTMSTSETKMLVDRLPAKYLGSSKPLKKILVEIIVEIEKYAHEARMIYAQVIMGMFVSLVAFGVATILELLHLRSLSAPPPFLVPYGNSLVFFLEFFLLTLGIGMLLRSLVKGAVLAFR